MVCFEPVFQGSPGSSVADLFSIAQARNDTKILQDPNNIFMTYIRLKINIPAKTKKKMEVRSLIVDALFWRKKESCSEVTPQ